MVFSPLYGQGGEDSDEEDLPVIRVRSTGEVDYIERPGRVSGGSGGGSSGEGAKGSCGIKFGHLLFLIFVNNLGKFYLVGGHTFLTLLFEIQLGGSFRPDMPESCLLAVKRWYDQNRLTFNT
ncbi:hypothetical protein J6590_068686 [Homalodisca vitripennis]|nr:hypothetical protein J6590_068686 [Homalodisca vitripennis]